MRRAYEILSGLRAPAGAVVSAVPALRVTSALSLLLISIKKTDGDVGEPQRRAFIIQQLFFTCSNIKSYFETVKVCKMITVSLCRPDGDSPQRGDNLSYSHPPGASACQQKIQILVIGRLTFLQSQVRMYVRGERCLPETLRNAAIPFPKDPNRCTLIP